MPPTPTHEARFVQGLVLIYGGGSGLGKSTIAGRLTARMLADGLSARLFREEDVVTHPAFRAYVQRVQAGHAGDTATLLESCRQLVSKLADRQSEIAVLDSVLPCWDWLYSAGCSDEEVSKFSEALHQLLSPLRPVLVLVEGDADSGLSRAMTDRGVQWALRLAEIRTGRRDVSALSSYFRALQAGAKRMLPLWSHPVIRVDTVSSDLDACVDHVLSVFRGLPSDGMSA